METRVHSENSSAVKSYSQRQTQQSLETSVHHQNQNQTSRTEFMDTTVRSLGKGKENSFVPSASSEKTNNGKHVIQGLV